MESIFSALKLLVPMLLTPIINRFISTFRVRQLYLGFDEVLPCVLPDTMGYTACVHIYNKGKDKETKVEVVFPNSSLCQVLACNYSGVAVEGNKVVVDRILPKQVVILNVYLDSTVPMSSLSKPSIKSEDANGKAYKGQGNIPSSLGPAVMGLSFFAALFITFMYIVFSGSNIFYPYYALRYSSLMGQGITPAGFSDNFLVSKASFASSSPIAINKVYVEGRKIILPLRVRNVTGTKIKITILHDMDNEDYKVEKERSRTEDLSLEQGVKAREMIEEKYGYFSGDELFFSDVVLGAGEDRTILLAHTVLPTTTVDNFNFFISIERGSYEGESFRDHYVFNIKKSSELPRVIEFLQTLQH